jgi:DNA-binding IclR family transcriptional regulator
MELHSVFQAKVRLTKMLRKIMDVLELFAFERRELGVLEVAAILERPKSTVSRRLSDMERAGFLDRDLASGRYRLSMRLAALGEVARQSTTLQQSARPYLALLAERTGETANLTVLLGKEAVNVEVADSPRPVMHVGWVGRHLPMHATAAGKVLLSYASEQFLEDVLAAGLTRLTPDTITDETALRADLAAVRARGYAMAWAELEPDLAAIAAPVCNHRGDVVAAIAIGGPVSRWAREHVGGLATHVIDAARNLSESMGYRDGARVSRFASSLE